jgi:hypothetical protein
MVDDVLQSRQRLTVNRLIRLIRQMPEEEQVSVLKQLLGGDIASHVIDLVNNMSYDQQLALLQQLDGIPQDERPIKTLLLDEEDSFMRGYLRKSCLIEAVYRIGEETHKGYVLDISILGVFLETRASFPVGQILEISFRLPDTNTTLDIEAEIAWSGRYGLGIKFRGLKKEQENLIKEFIDERGEA